MATTMATTTPTTLVDREIDETIEKYRSFTGLPRIGLKVLLCVLPLVTAVFAFDVPGYFGKSIFPEQYYAVTIALFMAAGFIMVPAHDKAPRHKVPWYDAVGAILGVICSAYLIFFYGEIARTSGLITPERVVLGTIIIVLIAEMTRRTLGYFLVGTIGVSILYALFGYMVPGIFSARPFSWERLVNFLYVDTSGILGMVFGIIMGLVLAFMFFGQVMFGTGGGQFLADFSFALMGRFRGGPAKVAVIASSLFGTISGSATANVATTGQFTIPMMKKVGYPAHVAGAIEAVAGSGGTIMPPVMGAAAFIMAEFLRIPYAEVAIAAALPAILYYIVCFYQVDLEAVKAGLKGLPSEQLPRLGKTLRAGWVFAIPLVTLVYLLFVVSYSPGKSAFIAAFAVMAVSMLFKESRITLKKLVGVLEGTGRLTVQMLGIGLAAGLILGVVSLTGLGFLFSQLLIAASGGNLYLLLLYTAIASIILGTGLPLTASYILLAILAAPALVSFGIEPLAAHLFVMYFAVMAFITPPVAEAVVVAAPLAGADYLKCAMTAMKFGMVAYIVPFIFVLQPALILKGDLVDTVISFVAAAAGFLLLCACLHGFLRGRLTTAGRIVAGVAGVALLAVAAYA